jgi:hypothetical protein
MRTAHRRCLLPANANRLSLISSFLVIEVILHAIDLQDWRSRFAVVV